MVFVTTFFTNITEKNAIKKGYLKIKLRQNKVINIFFALFLLIILTY